MSETHTKNYDASEIFKSEIEPVVEQLRVLCTEHNLPISLIICYAADGEQNKMCVMAGGDTQRMPRPVALLTSLLNHSYGTFSAAMSMLDGVLLKMATALEGSGLGAKLRAMMN